MANQKGGGASQGFGGVVGDYSYDANGLTGTWESRGSNNKPGCWEMTELDSLDNTVWAMTCGHYGGNQFIWKGSLSGDDFKMVSHKLLTRYTMVGFTKGAGHRLIVNTEAGKVYYTDNDGANWLSPTGIGQDIQSVIIDRVNSNKIYATNGQTVYVSTNEGQSFSPIKDFGSISIARLYSIRYGNQPGAGNVYLNRNGSFYKFNGSNDFNLQGSFTWCNNDKVSIGGDTRALYVACNRNWYRSTNEGVSWSTKSPTGYYYNEVNGLMNHGHHLGVHPGDPNIVIGGYATPVLSKDGLNSTIYHYSGWGHYQGGAGSVALQDQYTREMFHPDFQGSQFFYDKNGQVVSLRSFDGGVFKSYKE